MGGTGGFAVDEAKLEEVLRRLAAAKQADFSFSRDRHRPASAPRPKPLPPLIAQLRAAVAEKNAAVANEKQAQAVQKKLDEENGKRRLKQIKEKLASQLAERERRLRAELTPALEAVTVERRSRRDTMAVLMAASAIGLGIALFTSSWWLRWVGVLDGIFFGAWLLLYRYISLQTPGEQRIAKIRRLKRQARASANELLRFEVEEVKLEQKRIDGLRNEILHGLQAAMRAAENAYQSQIGPELTQRREALVIAERSLATYEAKWRKVSDGYLRERDKLVPMIEALIGDCRSLDSQYRGELQVLTANSEAAARLRHLRLNLIADADIPKIGTSRKQILASNGIFTAADIEVYKLQTIRGFGDVLTSNLVGWKVHVLRQFRFDPASAIPAAEHRSISAKFRQKQQQILAEMSRLTHQLDSLTTSSRAGIDQLIPAMQRSAAQYYQAEADLRLLSGRT